MYKEKISQKQAILLMATFIIGSSSMLGTGDKSGQDVWISVIISMAAASLIMAVYARIIKLFPDTDLYGILDNLFGKVLGRIISLIFIWYAFHLGAMIIRNICEFMRIVSLDSTPLTILVILKGLIIAYAVRSGIEVMGRWISIFFPVLITVTVILSLLIIDMYDIDRLKPILYQGFEPVLSDAFGVLTLPFGETVVFLGLAGCIQKKSSSYKIYYYSLLIGGIYLILTSVRTVMMIGPSNILYQMFPPYVTARLVKVGDFFQRVEMIVSVLIISCTFTKGTICLFSFTKGVAHFFNIKDYHKLALPLIVLAALYSLIVYNSAIEMARWALEIYPYYAIPFQIILPVIIWMVAEIKSRKNRKNTMAQSGSN